jgi:hypothetical protein
MIRITAKFRDKNFNFIVNPYDKIETIIEKVKTMFYHILNSSNFCIGSILLITLE